MLILLIVVIRAFLIEGLFLFNFFVLFDYFFLLIFLFIKQRDPSTGYLQFVIIIYIFDAGFSSIVDFFDRSRNYFNQIGIEMTMTVTNLR